MALNMKVKNKSAGKKSASKSASTKARSTSTAKTKNASTKGKASTAKNKGKAATSTANSVIDPEGAVAIKILKKLAKSKKGKTANELDTTPAIMQALEKAGKVKRNGTKPTGQRGRPPILWVVK